ncbi:SHOCT domain-containing protein [Candidatus Pelagibacter sp.]|nr:SHOCT domain-containing protein [Candidatus Pelagibacter sp.]
MEKIIFFGLVLPIFLFVLYLGGRAIMTGFSAKSSNKSGSEIETDNQLDDIPNNSESLSEELDKLNELLKSGALTQEEFEKAKKKILDN